jgi:hypothetical protein
VLASFPDNLKWQFLHLLLLQLEVDWCMNSCNSIHLTSPSFFKL